MMLHVSDTDTHILQQHARICHASIDVAYVQGRSVIVSERAGALLKFICPRRIGDAAWIYMSGYGGGLVSGDETHIQVNLQEKSTLVLTTQASNKVYHQAHGRTAVQTVKAEVASGAMLIHAPDPLVCYKDAVYQQKQVFRLQDSNASLLVVDWMTCGRLAMNERWAFKEYDSNNVIYLGDKCICRDRVILSNSDKIQASLTQVGTMNSFANVYIVGEKSVESMHGYIKGLAGKLLKPEMALIESIGMMDDVLVWRMAAKQTETIMERLKAGLGFVKHRTFEGIWDRKS